MQNSGKIERSIEKTFVLIMSMFILGSLMLAPASAAPPIKNPGELIKAAMQDNCPESVDPAWAYDTVSSELIMNIYDTLITFDGEHMETYIPSLATSWTVQKLDPPEVSPEGLDWYYRYTFAIRTGVRFHYGELLNTTDVEYSFERAMVQDRVAGPTWMFYEPLLYCGVAADLGNLSDPVDIAKVGWMIDHAVESNSTHVWFNLAFPGAYAPFLQILSQTWSGILDKVWVNNYVKGVLGRPDWSGNWMLGGNHTDWINYHEPNISPLDSPTPIMNGCGPFIFGTLAATFWSINRFVGYWRGWPAPFPALFGSTPKGYVEQFVCTWAFVWETRSAMFLNGDVDFCDVPRQYISQIQGKDGIRLIPNLMSFACDGMFYTFDISPTTSYGKIYGYGDFNNGDGIPRDFFGGSPWGIHIRKAFSYAFDYDTYLSVAFLNQAVQPPTAIIPTLPYYDSATELQKYNFNITRATEEFLKANATTGLWETGFAVVLVYDTGNLPRQTACNLLQTAIASINPKFRVIVTSANWRPYLIAARAHQLAIYSIGWLADYPDPHNFAYPFYRTGGAFSIWQLYSNSTMDALIDLGITQPDGPARADTYSDIQFGALNDVPSVIISSTIGMHFERDWIVGWYYNPIYPGEYAYNIWKWYYVEEALQSTAAQPYSNRLPVDVNYDGKVDTKDIGVAAKSFGSDSGPPIHPRWVYRADVDNSRKVDMADVGRVARNFGKNSIAWSPPVQEPSVVAFGQLNFCLDGVPTLNSDWGAVDVSFCGSANIQYLNLIANGTWSIRNLPVLSVEGDNVTQTQRFWFPLGVPSGTDITYIPYGINLTDYVLGTTPVQYWVAYVGDVDYVVYNGGLDVTLHTAPPPATVVVGGAVADPVQHKHENFPNQERGWYECVPAAVSNSLQFLNAKHKLGMKPEDITIEKMKTATNWGEKMPGEKGCWIDHNDSRPAGEQNAWWEDKDAYMKANNLPITTKKVLPKDISTLAGEIDEGQDIEMELNGHTVCIVGFADLGGGNYSVTIVHDSDPSKPGGCIPETGTWDSNTSTWSGALAGYGLNYFIVECPKK